MAKRFAKYHGTGNDFILLMGSGDREILDAGLVQHACTRHTGIGADGLMVLWPSTDSDFSLDYYNADGQLGSLCGNGSRCAVHFAKSHELFEGHLCIFDAADGRHQAEMDAQGWVTVHFADAPSAVPQFDGWFVNTGSPHHLLEVEDIDTVNALSEGSALRYGPYAASGGSNINWLSCQEGHWKIRTYERGVEAETLSCGTGAVAAALYLHQAKGLPSPIRLQARGGLLEVGFSAKSAGFSDITLKGPATHVYDGIWPW
ncbi:MAG: diaminopimelate epimerase [Bacteroidota bacterium]